MVSLLPALGADLTSQTLFGYSGGASFAHNMHVAYNLQYKGVGLLQGSVYGQNPLNTKSTNVTDITLKAQKLAEDNATNKTIVGDLIANFPNATVAIYSGLQDKMMDSIFQNATENFYKNYNVSSIKVIREANGNHFNWWLGKPPGKRSTWDLVGDMLKFVLKDPNMKPASVDWEKEGILKAFNQTEAAGTIKLGNNTFAWADLGLDDEGYIYYPKGCAQLQKCKIVTVFHGCTQQVQGEFGLTMVKRVGWTQWAAKNNLIMLFPQVKQNKFNGGCFDAFGGNKKTKAVHLLSSSPQMLAFINMQNRLGGNRTKDKTVLESSSVEKTNDLWVNWYKEGQKYLPKWVIAEQVKMSAIGVSIHYRWCLLVIILQVCYYFILPFAGTSTARYEYLGPDEMAKWKELHSEETGVPDSQPPGGGMPDQGSGRYIIAAGYKAWMEFQGGQRIHQNLVEFMQQVVVSELIAGIYMPITITIWAGIYLIARIGYQFKKDGFTPIIVMSQIFLPWVAFAAMATMWAQTPYKRNSQLKSGLFTDLIKNDPTK